MATSSRGHLGQSLYANNGEIMPNCPVDAPNGDGTVLAGECIPYPSRANPVRFVLTMHDTADGEVTPGTFEGNGILVRKKAGEAWVKGDRLTLVANADAAKNDYVFEKATSGVDAVHAIAIEDADSADTFGVIDGPLPRPFETAP